MLAIYPGITGVFTSDWWRYYLFLQSYDASTLPFGIPVAWTLCVEVAFYVSLPFWALAVRHIRLGAGPRAWIRSELAALAAVATAAVAVQVAASRRRSRRCSRRPCSVRRSGSPSGWRSPSSAWPPADRAGRRR